MGRPRKRRHVEEPAPDESGEEPESLQTHRNLSSVSHPSLWPFDAPSDALKSSRAEMTSMEPGWSGLLPSDPGQSVLQQSFPSVDLDILGLMPGQDATAGDAWFDFQQSFEFLPEGNKGVTLPNTLTLNGVEGLDDINFDTPTRNEDHKDEYRKTPSSSTPSLSHDQSSQPHSYARSSTSDTSPSMSLTNSRHQQQNTNSSPPPLPTPSQPLSIQNVSCGCLSSIYLALDSLSRLPKNVTSAMRTARTASSVAYNIIHCPICFNPLAEDVTAAPNMQSFQNLMLLDTLLPSICNAYAVILEMVDREAEDAKAAGRTISFTFSSVGGLWGVYNDGEAAGCPQIDSYDNRDMPGDMWRMIVRAILRLDIYGINENTMEAESSAGASLSSRKGYTQLGLKDIVKLIDERSNRRHEKMDDAIRSGKMLSHHKTLMCTGPPKIVPPEERNCLRVLDTARIALENLTIA